MKTLSALVLIIWVMLAPDVRGSFGSEAACAAAIAAWQRQARDGARWVTAQQQQALQQTNQEIILFWRQAGRRAAEQEAQVRGAQCVERS